MQNQTFVQDPKMTDCIEACNDTREAALRTLAWVTSEGFDNATPEFVRLLSDVAEICVTAGNFMLRGSELHHETCKACEEVCEAALEACEQSGLDEIEDLKEQLESCIEHCRDMASAGGRTTSEGNFSREESTIGRRGGTKRTEPTKGRARTSTTLKGGR